MPDMTTSCALESILCTDDLKQRPSRPPDHESENRALTALAQSMADAPQTILQKLADTILEMLSVGSAGISLLTEDERRFYWPAIAGIWKPHIGGGTPREFGPCGDVLDRNIPLMFTHVERRYTYFQPVAPAVEECLLAPFYVEGKAVGTVWAVAHDLTRKFDAEDMRQLVSMSRFASSAYQTLRSLAQLQEAKREAEEANRAKDKFLAVLSHELRTPLTPAMMAVAAQELDDQLPPVVREDARMIRRNLELEVKLIDDLLDLSSIKSGKLRLHLGVLDINDLMQHVCDMCLSNIRERGIRLHCDLDRGASNVVGDPARLQQVFWNLLKNATKFTPEGGDIHVTVENVNTNQVRVTVKDSGIGIAPDSLARIFDAFEQGDVLTAQRFGGMGLGLAISKLLVNEHRGSIRAETAGPNKGSTFIVELPAFSNDQSPPTPVKSLPAIGGQVKSLRLLLVEDHADTAILMSRLLAMSGHTVTTAATGTTALTLADERHFDVVISDLGLPDMTGYELMRRLRERHGTKGVALSGYCMDSDIRKCLEAGFSEHLVKPVNIQQLEHTILRVAASAQA
jgi:signal transduction histidine kinase